VVLAGGLAVGLVLLSSTSAWAVKTHVFSTSFGSSGAGAGQVSSPQGVAINDSTGDVYVADAGSNRVDEFRSSGSFIRAWGWGVADGASQFETCTTTCQSGIASATPSPGQFDSPTFIAVDNSVGPSAGDVYVGDGRSDNVVTKFDANGSVVSSWGAAGQLSGSSSTVFGPLAGITVDSSGNLVVFDANSVQYVFDQAGASTSQTTVARGTNPNGIAVDSAGSFFKVNGDGSTEEFTSTGTDVGQVTTGNATSIAVDQASGDLFVDTGGQVDDYGFDGSGNVLELGGSTCTPASFSGCSPTNSFGSGQLTRGTGVAVNSATGNVYIADVSAGDVNVFTPATLPDVTTGAAMNLGATTATLSGTINPGGTTITDCHFVYVDQAGYDPSAANPYAAGGIASCVPTPSGSSPVAVSAELSNLTGGTVYHFRLEAGNSQGTSFGSDQTFTTPGPSVSSTSVANVTVDSAELQAQINPNGNDTTYHFEYGTSAGVYPNSTPELSAGSGDVNISVLGQLSGLQPGTAYHYRVVASNSGGTTDGLDQSFTTFERATFAPCPNDQLRYGYGAQLPDCRAYEQVTPVNKGGGGVTGNITADLAAAGGDGVTFTDLGGLPGIPGGTFQFPLYIASRGADGWSSANVLPPASASSWSGVSSASWSGDLSRTFLSATIAGAQDLLAADPATGAYQVIAADPDAVPEVDGFSADDSTVVFEDKGDQLLPSAAAGRDNVYDYDFASGALRLVGVLPDGTTPTGGSFAGAYDWPSADTNFGGENVMNTPSAISSNGNDVFFTANADPGHDSGTAQVFVRQNPTSAGAHTVQVSASQKTNGTGTNGTDPSGPQPAAFMDATPDGSHVLFTSSEELTNDATTGSADQGNDLYEYDVQTGGLTDIVPDTGDVDGADVQGVLGMSDDGSFVYFVANGVLAPGASQGTCAFQQFGNRVCNLYVWHDGRVSFIAQLSANGSSGDFSDWTPFKPSPGSENTARVSADGTALLFASKQSLTGYANNGFSELYRYSYSASGGRLECVSCDPSGSKPVGSATLHSNSTGADGVGGNSPALTRNFSESGDQVFFESSDQLVLQAVNGMQNVYEWEADGAGSCRSTSQNGGCLYLISSGTSPDPSYFADASASGNDVFFFTTQPLVGQDTDQLLDVYDARVDGGITAQNPPKAQPPCAGDTCRGPSTAAPATPTVASITFSGPGDERATSPRTAKLANVRITKKAVTGRRFTLSVKVPAKGRITITGADVTKATRAVARAGTYKLSLKLTAKAKLTLKKKRRLKVAVRAAYKPSSGNASAASVSIEMKA